MSVIEQAITKSRQRTVEVPARETPPVPLGLEVCDLAKRIWHAGPTYQSLAILAAAIGATGAAELSIRLADFIARAGVWAGLIVFCAVSLGAVLGWTLAGMCMPRHRA